tara:strand:+ start:731 stop:1291 length:561 start_codon:yes stop_codon:yes gene_type:complete
MSAIDTYAISDTNTLHGGALIMLMEAIHNTNPKIKYSIDFCESKSKYKINFSCEEWQKKEISLGLFIKHSQKRISPWRYTFTKEHQNEIIDLFKTCDSVFILLIASQKGIAVINKSLYEELLDENIDESEWISLSRKHNENFRIRSKDKNKKDTLAKNCFPNLITDFLKNLSEENEKKLLSKFKLF